MLVIWPLSVLAFGRMVNGGLDEPDQPRSIPKRLNFDRNSEKMKRNQIFRWLIYTYDDLSNTHKICIQFERLRFESMFRKIAPECESGSYRLSVIMPVEKEAGTSGSLGGTLLHEAGMSLRA